MARIRSVHPSQWDDWRFLMCSPLARLLAIALRNEADDNGVFLWEPQQIKVRLLPGDNCEVEGLLGELVENRQVFRYAAEGRVYGIIRNFLKFQRPRTVQIDHPVPAEVPHLGYSVCVKGGAKRELPVFKEADCNNVEGLTELSPGNCNTKESLTELSSGNGYKNKSLRGGVMHKKPKSEIIEEERRGEEEEGECEIGEAPDSAPPLSEFEILEGYPDLAGAWDGVLTALARGHPKLKFPKRGSKRWLDWQRVLRDLVRLDGYSEAAVLDVLRWVFGGDCKDAVFWRGNVQGLGRLRDRDDGVSKFDKIESAWRKSGGASAVGGNGRGVLKPEDWPADWAKPEFTDGLDGPREIEK